MGPCSAQIKAQAKSAAAPRLCRDHRAQQPGALPPSTLQNRMSWLGKGPCSTPEHRMIRFCPGCRGQIKPSFTFCPYCGEVLPQKDDPGSGSSPEECGTAGKVPRKKRTRRSQGVQRKKLKWPTPVTPPPTTPPRPQERVGPEASPSFLGKARGQDAHPKQKPVKILSPASVGKLKVLTDKDGQSWSLGAPVPSSENGMLFEAVSASETTFPKQRFSLKLDLKSGRLFHEQNFFQRAVKEKEVHKWKKSHLIPFLAVPACTSFGLHQDTYRFLVFPDLGRSLQSILDDRPRSVLTEKTGLHILFRLVDALEFIHENEYVHGNVSTENIFVNPDTLGQVLQPRLTRLVSRHLVLPWDRGRAQASEPWDPPGDLGQAPSQLARFLLQQTHGLDLSVSEAPGRLVPGTSLVPAIPDVAWWWEHWHADSGPLAPHRHAKDAINPLGRLSWRVC
ncbi:inactive serine/threonine-protein kinase VRK3 isoform X4 [Dromiciops gliroides]|uniref:inactive serine/threonine-protein kinase VRK3 isoform X4 n=1 Tax=Dromiciops gliroides TaxID=33562 RepID=UPI001CC6164A|nr:inactive serine/threonine-protein kinase VRK3 isoform X4 [Dromiciops gliroides]